MRRIDWMLLGLEAALVTAFAVALRSGRFPLGIAGEWEWQRITATSAALPFLMGLAAVIAYSAFAAIGFRTMSRNPSHWRIAAWLTALVMASVGVQGVVQEAAPEGFGLSKWIFSLHTPGSSGYYTVAKAQMADSRQFLADYPAWIEKQDSLHVGTHPPGLFVLSRLILDAMEANPSAARWICAVAPPSASSAIMAYRETIALPRADSAALALTGALTLLGCSLTVVPLYFLARSGLSGPASWASAAFWPLVPSALMFQPTADTAFALISTTALALACWACRSESRRGLTLCVASGLVMALGMFFTLAFLPVGLVVALVLLTSPEASRGRQAALFLATGTGFLAGTMAWGAATSTNPFAIWWINQRNHSRFYVEYPRSYFAWVAENPIELAIALGLPASILASIGFSSARQVPRVAWATLVVLTVLTLSGKNLSEVARLWLPLMPPLLVAAGSGISKVGGNAWTLGASLALMGLQVLAIQSIIQVVYPI